jgi:hypothetical protein
MINPIFLWRLAGRPGKKALENRRHRARGEMTDDEKVALFLHAVNNDDNLTKDERIARWAQLLEDDRARERD